MKLTVAANSQSIRGLSAKRGFSLQIGSKYTAYFYSWTFASICLLLSLLPSITSAEIDTSRSLGILSEQKEKAESDVEVLHDLRKGKSINKIEFLKGKQLYGEAKAAFNGWIDRLQSDVLHGRDLTMSNEYQKSLNAAAQKSDKFSLYVKGKIPQSSKGELSDEIQSVFEVLADTGRFLWSELSGQNEQQEREYAIQELEEFKWAAFNQLALKN